MNIEHDLIPAGEIHVAHNWEFPDSNARESAGITDDALRNRLALQIDDGSYWRLASVSPMTWAAVGGSYTPFAHVGAGGDAHAGAVPAGAAGFMSGSDKAKLDAITGTNTGDQTKAGLGMGNVDNTSDTDKPVSALQQAALNLKAGFGPNTFTARQTIPASLATVLTLGSVSGVQTLDLAAATEFVATIGGATTFAFANAPGAGQSQIAYLRLTNAGAFTVTWPASTKFPGGALGLLTAAGVDLLGVKFDPTTGTYMVFVIGKDIK